jgi:ABC-type multidrug transport system fused ATPase/permease subunit
MNLFRKPKLIKIEWLKLVNESLFLLDAKSRRRIFVAMIALSCLSIVDIIAIGLVGLLSLMTLNGITIGGSSTRVSTLFEILQIDNLNFQSQALVLAIMIATLLIAKTFFSVILSKKLLLFLSFKSSQLSKNLVEHVMHRDVNSVQSLPRANINYGISEGVDRIVVGVLGSLANIGSDFVLISLLVVTLNFVDLALGLTSIVFFGLIGVGIYLKQGNTSAKLGKVLGEKRIEISDQLFGLIDSLREIELRGSLSLNIDKVSKLRTTQARAWAEMSFQPYMAKYSLEVGMVLGGLVVAGAQFLIHDAKHAISVLSLFLAAGVRIIPAILRLQSNLTNIRASSGVASITLDLFRLPVSPRTLIDNSLDQQAMLEGPDVNFSDVSFSYQGSQESTLNKVNLRIQSNHLTAIVGPSGSGKSTLFDLALGFTKPQHGTVTIAGIPTTAYVDAFPGAISLVPQNVRISKESLRENLLLGYETKLSDSEIVQILHELNLNELFNALPKGLDSDLGEFGSRLSGGQRQRIGIARALCTSPNYLFLDEATSSLDALTENVVMEFLTHAKRKLTIVVIAHRLSTVRNADQVVYLEKGTIQGQGTFEEVRRQVPDFEKQATLLGVE